MEIAEKVMRAQTDDALRELFIKENMAFIYSCAAQAAGHFVDESDDIFSVAFTAFNDAVSSYEERKGYFHSFAKSCIYNRIKDYYRVKIRHNRVVPFSSLSTKNDNGEETEFEIEDKNTEMSETALEIFSLKSELAPFGISFFELPKAAPKFRKTRVACVEIVKYIVREKELLASVYEKKTLPVKQVLSTLNVNKKVLERHRKYLIMGILIMNGNYEILSEYFDPEYRRWQ
ncbi:sigma factor [Congzhengia minquanensis]|uniref:RNA polymerase sigma factor SigI n=1 Tax=Congzhengia minquanensis TaxID=2763657 RepID=A0A926HZD0_9FIRM|nr:sigma factor [Congzhengia minquanensis]MBC8540711.1 hypothetical protein [Congzhengia minquanensis]